MDFVDAMQHSPVDERDMLVDAIDALEHEPSAEVADAGVRLARRYLEGIADLTNSESALLNAAVESKGSGFHETCALALAGLVALWLRVRERAH